MSYSNLEFIIYRLHCSPEEQPLEGIVSDLKLQLYISQPSVLIKLALL